MQDKQLNGLLVLIVEDDPIIALDIAQSLSDAGATIIGPAHTVAAALSIIDQHSPDLAVLDWWLESETTSEVAQRLGELAVPFIFHTSSCGLPAAAHPGAPIVDKPTRPEQLVGAVKALTRGD